LTKTDGSKKAMGNFFLAEPVPLLQFLDFKEQHRQCSTSHKIVGRASSFSFSTAMTDACAESERNGVQMSGETKILK
jgi:hypothetical protein